VPVLEVPLLSLQELGLELATLVEQLQLSEEPLRLTLVVL
jgi:hypothetical protein